MSKMKMKSPEGFGMSRTQWFICGLIMPLVFGISVVLRLVGSERMAVDFLRNNNIID
jgi:hypothetical protein